MTGEPIVKRRGEVLIPAVLAEQEALLPTVHAAVDALMRDTEESGQELLTGAGGAR